MLKSRNVIFLSIASTAIAVGLVAGASQIGNRNNEINGLLKADAVDKSAGTIEFTSSGITQSSASTTTIKGTTQTGGVIYCQIIGTDESPEEGYIGKLKNNSVILFYEEDLTTFYTFEDMDKISFTKEDDSSEWSYTLDGAYDTGTTFSLNYEAETTATRGTDFTELGNVTNIMYTYTHSDTSNLKEIKINYSCSSKTLVSLKIEQAPTKTSYIEGETFDPTGMIVKAVYSNGAEVATYAYTYSPADTPLTTSDNKITISYNGKSAEQNITVAKKDVINTYIWIYGSNVYTISLNFTEKSGEYRFKNYTVSSLMHFTFTQVNNIITFTKAKQEGDSEIDSSGGGYYNLFTMRATGDDAIYNTTNTGTLTKESNGDDYLLLCTCNNTERQSSAKHFAKKY